MADVNSMIEQVKSSNLSNAEKDRLIKMIVRRGPNFDLLGAINEIKKTSTEERDKTIHAISFLVVLAFLFIMFSGIIFKTTPVKKPSIIYAPSNSGESTSRREDTRGGAHVWAKGFVRERLRSPSTAKFASVLNANFTDLGNRKWRVVSYVDAQNAFGTEVRTYFDAVVRYVGNDQWELISLNTNQ